MMSIMFEEATRCPDCQSDRIYVLQDTDGGICLVCKAILSGPIKGGISYAVYAMENGILEEPETANDLDRKAIQAEEAKAAAAKIKEDLAMARGLAVIGRGLASMGRTAETPRIPMPEPKKEVLKKEEPRKEEPKKEKGPSIFQKAKSWLMAQGEKIKTASEKPATVTATAAKDPKEVGLPKVGEAWSIGPCKTCRLTSRQSGKVKYAKAIGNSDHFIVLENSYYGCFFCSKKM
jgi:hypothetical protein